MKKTEIKRLKDLNVHALKHAIDSSTLIDVIEFDKFCTMSLYGVTLNICEDGPTMEINGDSKDAGNNYRAWRRYFDFLVRDIKRKQSDKYVYVIFAGENGEATKGLLRLFTDEELKSRSEEIEAKLEKRKRRDPIVKEMEYEALIDGTIGDKKYCLIKSIPVDGNFYNPDIIKDDEYNRSILSTILVDNEEDEIKPQPKPKKAFTPKGNRLF